MEWILLTDLEWIWLVVILALVLIELMSLNLTSIWFALSGIISFILLKTNQAYTIQVVSFLIIGILLIILVRPHIIGRFIKWRNKVLAKMTDKYPFTKHFVPSDIKYTESNDRKGRNNHHKK